MQISNLRLRFIQVPWNPHLHDGVGGQDLLLDVGLAGRAADRGKVSHGVLGRHRFPRSRLSAYDDGLVPLIPGKTEIRQDQRLMTKMACDRIAQWSRVN